MSESIPSAFTATGVHRAILECWSCDGEGSVGDYKCGLCSGKGTIKVGCGGRVAYDPLHLALGADCPQCGGAVPTTEVS